MLNGFYHLNARGRAGSLEPGPSVQGTTITGQWACRASQAGTEPVR
jgi:hypothetical protein